MSPQVSLRDAADAPLILPRLSIAGLPIGRLHGHCNIRGLSGVASGWGGDWRAQRRKFLILEFSDRVQSDSKLCSSYICVKDANVIPQ
jgi:hypothetical protein